ncbi:MAG: phosphate regulon sensor histidine kinase PhoR [Thiohalocapsa sp.]|jgi:two-component system phosphate regulon sensor histidine kinase PhoR
MRGPVLYEINLALGTAALAGLIALLGQPPDRALLLALLPYLARHLIHLGRLARLIRRHHRLVPPFPNGLWGEIYRAVGQYQQRGRKGRKRQLRFTRRFREAANSVPDALIVLDKTKRIEWANPAAAALMGVQWPQQHGRPLVEVFHCAGLEEYVDAGEYGRPIEVSPEHNQTLMLSLRVAPFGERKKQRLVVGRDITKVFHLNMIRRDFVANASHELRTPLTVIGGFLENLCDSAQTPEQHRRPLMLMQNQTQRMRSIIEDLLTLSRLEMDQHADNLTPVDVAAEVDDIVANALVLSEGAHALDLELDRDLLVIGNAPELHSAFSNLIFNAVRHTPPGSRIRVCWHESDSGPVFSVQDDGPGIAATHIPRLTERFYRVDKARSRASGGTGLGLAIVKHVLSRHDASLSIASELGKGATFSCLFPAADRLRRSAVAPRPDDAETPSTPRVESQPLVSRPASASGSAS